MSSRVGWPVMQASSVRQVMARLGRAAAAFTGVMLALQMVLAPLLHGAGTSANPATTRQIEYVIQRNGKRIGHYQFGMVQTAVGIREVHVSMGVRVKALGVPVYNVRLERSERWRGDELLALQGESLRNGEPGTMELTKEAGTTRLTVNGKPEILTQSAYTFVPWLIEYPGEVVLITEKGKPLRVTREDLGLETVELAEGPRRLRHHVYRGPWERDAWYDAEGRLVLLRYEKSGATIRMLLTSDRVETGSIAPVAADRNSVEWAR